MTTVSPGALVMVKKMGTILWVVCGRADDGVSWKLRAKRATSAEGRTSAAAWPAPAISSPGTHLLARHHERTHDEDSSEHSLIRFVTITEQEDLRQTE